MAKVNREYMLSPGVVVNIAINEGVAVMISNYAKELEKIYFQAKKDGKNVQWDYRKHAMIEMFDCSIEEYVSMLDKDYETSKIKQAEAQKWALENKK